MKMWGLCPPYFLSVIPGSSFPQVPRPMSPPNGCSSSWLPILHPTPLRAQRQMGRHGDRQARRPQTSSQSVLEKKALKLQTMVSITHTHAYIRKPFLEPTLSLTLTWMHRHTQTHTHTCASSVLTSS